MPIVDISGLAAHEAEAKTHIRERIQAAFHERLDVALSATTVTFITDSSTGVGRSVHVMARLYSQKFMEMPPEKLNEICDRVVTILEEEGGHDFNEAFPIPVMAMRGRPNPNRPKN